MDGWVMRARLGCFDDVRSDSRDVNCRMIIGRGRGEGYADLSSFSAINQDARDATVTNAWRRAFDVGERSVSLALRTFVRRLGVSRRLEGILLIIGFVRMYAGVLMNFMPRLRMYYYYI